MNNEEPKSPWHIDDDSELAKSISKEETMRTQQESLARSITARLDSEKIKYEVAVDPDPRSNKVIFKLLQGIPSRFHAIFEEEIKRFNDSAEENHIPQSATMKGDSYIILTNVVERKDE